jgi:fatty acid synthase subunit beta
MSLLIALTPMRHGTDFTEKDLSSLVSTISTETCLLIEIVNWNVRNHQYICAGDKRALHLLQRVTDDVRGIVDSALSQQVLLDLVRKHVDSIPTAAKPIQLRKSAATLPLAGIDAPFHSSLLQSHKDMMRMALTEAIRPDDLDLENIAGKWIPNTMGMPFAINEEFLRRVFAVTKAESLKALANKLNIAL